MLDNFAKLANMPETVIKKYGSQVPIELRRIWEEDGLGTFVDGYLKVINPDDYSALVKSTYFRGDMSIPIFVTAFGDVITLEEGKYLRIVKYSEGDFVTILANIAYFIQDILDEDFLNDYFDIPFYQKAVQKYGDLTYQQCFGFVPLLALGGTKSVDNLEKVNISEHLSILTQLTGGVGFD
ncbi:MULTISPECIES: T6SS immunity protein Tdi1 domain-containing protein [Streptococcus]|uniref:T6SS immunity protein Tdi1 domain-containing protein n=1 Tax=Streptococcus TaxID=1301 RepID=UPI000CF4BB89|nr:MULTISPECIES: T6SS immunity protein Tdi1 domain-containing protein [Streptococcus]MBM7191689.1 DUF1851 domain-containing protein [Streptococcus suis]MBO4111188.1 DUF1851 domain-containing protein [Streptococcus suis]MBY0718391.1 DUF1851 domain-containing protein [Streptococcus sp. 2018110]MCO8223941.1 DUF1851 domain-containing protein [Streptococcus suis]MCO8233896.1 DUF1851 domain-containing protein [Streptococcus suis]